MWTWDQVFTIFINSKGIFDYLINSKIEITIYSMYFYVDYLIIGKKILFCRYSKDKYKVKTITRWSNRWTWLEINENTDCRSRKFTVSINSNWQIKSASNRAVSINLSTDKYTHSLSFSIHSTYRQDTQVTFIYSRYMDNWREIQGDMQIQEIKCFLCWLIGYVKVAIIAEKFT